MRSVPCFSHRLLLPAVIAVSLSPLLTAAMTVTVETSLPAPQPVGTAVTFTATSTGSVAGPATYRFEMLPPASATYILLRDFSLSTSFEWVPSIVEGNYQIRVTARDYLAGDSVSQMIPFTITSALSGGQAAVTSTRHPLVALYSAPSCQSGSSMRVVFRKAGTTTPSYTDFRACRPGTMNFLVGGLLPNSTYEMTHQLLTGGTVTSGGTLLRHTAGGVPSDLLLPEVDVLQTPDLGYSAVERINLFSFPSPYTPAATDLSGRPVWYYPDVAASGQLLRPLPGGGFLLFASGPGTGTGPYGPASMRQQLFREIDLAGNIKHEISADRISEMLAALGKPGISRFNHDALRLKNGYTVVMADAQRAYPPGTQGSPFPLDVIGAVVVVLDPNWNVTWYWNAFEHAAGNGELNIQRAAIRGEVCSYGAGGATQIGCPPILLPGFFAANDWLHANSLFLTTDGNLIMSLRNQDWLIKINYANGAGNGRVLWRMGKDGDFDFISSDPWPWFSGQHEAAFEFGGNTHLSLFDNGNTRRRALGGNSRGQVLLVDEDARTATPLINNDLGVYSSSQGSAQPLSNGHWSFQAGALTLGLGFFARNLEVGPDSAFVYKTQANSVSYRTWRLRDFYAPPTT